MSKNASPLRAVECGWVGVVLLGVGVKWCCLGLVRFVLLGWLGWLCVDLGGLRGWFHVRR